MALQVASTAFLGKRPFTFWEYKQLSETKILRNPWVSRGGSQTPDKLVGRFKHIGFCPTLLGMTNLIDFRSLYLA